MRLDGKDHYLGKYSTAAAQAAYERLIAERLASPQHRDHKPLRAFCWSQGQLNEYRRRTLPLHRHR